jgi:hypothetical protein
MIETGREFIVTLFALSIYILLIIIWDEIETIKIQIRHEQWKKKFQEKWENHQL